MAPSPPAPVAAVAPGAPSARRWDIFCHVVDNFGDIGVCWRLATQLAARGAVVRLVVDDASALAWMAPGREQRPASLTVLSWPGPVDAAEVVLEAFGCNPPEAYVRAMRAVDPVWINLEYLSAEDFVERSHALPSPRADGLRKWFFYPGFTERTGGLLREPDLMQRRTAFDCAAWLATRGLRRTEGERVVSLFCYENAPLAALLQSLAAQPTLLLLTPGAAQQQLGATPAGMRTAALPWLSQLDFDHLLWASDLNCVRGEDSFVRALWAGTPFLWQAYPQLEGAHAAKVEAALARLALPADVARAWRAWNGLGNGPAEGHRAGSVARVWPGLPALAPWQAATVAARARLLEQDDLMTRLVRFVASRLPVTGHAT